MRDLGAIKNMAKNTASDLTGKFNLNELEQRQFLIELKSEIQRIHDEKIIELKKNISEKQEELKILCSYIDFNKV